MNGMQPVTDYERPNRRWRCDGRRTPCPRGPDRIGRCQGEQDCRPQAVTDGWLCTRPAHRGGRCVPGPLANGRCGRQLPPCLPRRTFRGLRGVVVSLTIAACTGLAALGLGLGWW